MSLVLIVVAALTLITGAAVKVPAASLLTIGDLVVPICGEHATGDPASSSPVLPTQPNHCEACVLAAAVVLPEPMAFLSPAVGRWANVGSTFSSWAPAVSRLRVPRQSQGPPTA